MHLNITEHALMRYAQRFEDEHISNDSIFREWKKRNIDKAEKYEKSLRILFQVSEFLTEGIYDKNRKLASFYISEDDQVCFVCDKKQQNIITVYFIDFGIDEAGNKKILSLILDHIENTKVEKEEFEKIRSEELTELQRRKKTLEQEKEEYREKIKEIESEQQLINKQIELSSNKSKTLTARLQNSYRKIIKSIEF